MRILRSPAAFLGLVLAGAAGPCAAAESAPAALLSTATVTVDMIYYSAKKRSPLKVSTLAVDEHGPKSRTLLSGVSTTTFSVYNLFLTGLMEDPRSKQAMLTDQATGAFYTLKAGRLLDAKKNQVPGVSGVIKGKQVILMTEDKKIHQLTLRQKE